MVFRESSDPAIRRDTLPVASMVEVLRRRALATPHREAIAYTPDLLRFTRRLTYAGLDRRVRALAGRLQQAGASGARALLVLENDPDYLVAFLACAYAGTIAVTLHPPTQKKHVARLGHVARDCDAAFVLSTGPVAAKFGAAIAANAPPMDWMLVEEVDEADSWVEHRPATDDVAYLQYTSGSTGAPRGVVVTHANLVYQGVYFERAFGFTPNDRALSWLPLYHDMGLILGALQPLFTGFPLLLTTPLAFVKNPERWLRMIGEEGVTFSGGPDFCYDLCCELVDPATLAGVDLSRWEVALDGAEPVRARTIAKFVEKFGPLGFRSETINPGYGLAELTLAGTVKPRGTLPVLRTVDADALEQDRVEAPRPDGRSITLVSSGRHYPDERIRIVRDTRSLGPNEVGEIWIAGTAAAAGYWRRPEETAATFGARLADGDGPFLRTGDLGFLDEAGELFVTGRLKDLLIVHGRNHYPSDIEQTVERASEAVRPHCVGAFAAPGEGRDRVIVVAEVRREIEAFDAEDAARTIFRAVSGAHEVAVDEVVFVHHGQVPKTTSGKIQRSACRAAWRDRTFLEHARVAR